LSEEFQRPEAIVFDSNDVDDPEINVQQISSTWDVSYSIIFKKKRKNKINEFRQIHHFNYVMCRFLDEKEN